LVLLYDQAKEPLGVGKFNPMWHDPYIVRLVIEKGAYELEDYKGNVLDVPKNELYLKFFYTSTFKLECGLCILMYVSVYIYLFIIFCHGLLIEFSLGWKMSTKSSCS
jgi:hypothetical protein